MKGNIKKWTQRSINKTLIAFNSKFLYNFNLNVQIFKWSVTNDETISDQPTESLRELLLFEGTPFLFVENSENFLITNTTNFYYSHWIICSSSLMRGKSRQCEKQKS